MYRDQKEALAELLRLARDEYLEGVELGDGERRRRGEWLMDEISRLLHGSHRSRRLRHWLCRAAHD